MRNIISFFPHTEGMQRPVKILMLMFALSSLAFAQVKFAPAVIDSTKSESLPVEGRYVVQLIAIPNKTVANNMAEKLKREGYQAYVMPVINPTPKLSGKHYRVRIGCFTDSTSAKNFALRELVPLGYEYWIDSKYSDNLGFCGEGFDPDADYSDLPPVVIHLEMGMKAPEPIIEISEPEPEPEPEEIIDEPEPVPPVKRKNQIGLRLAANLSSAKGMSVRVHYFDFDNMEERYTDYRSSYGYIGGIGYEIQVPIFYGLSQMLALYTAPGFAYRAPFSSADDIASISEFALTFPLMFDLKFADTPLHASFGVQLDVPLSAKTEREDGKKFDFKERASVDFGLAAGLSYYITENIFIDGRGVYGLTNYAGKGNGSLYQFSFGAGWLFGL